MRVIGVSCCFEDIALTRSVTAWGPEAAQHLATRSLLSFYSILFSPCNIRAHYYCHRRRWPGAWDLLRSHHWVKAWPGLPRGHPFSAAMFPWEQKPLTLGNQSGTPARVHSGSMAFPYGLDNFSPLG